MLIVQGWTKKWSPGCENLFRQVEAEVVSNNREKFTKRGYHFLANLCYYGKGVSNKKILQPSYE